MSELGVYPPPAAGHSADNWITRVTRIEETVERWLGSRLLVLLVFTGVYAAITAYIASLKLLWDDEFFTLYISNARGWSDMIAALSTGADQHPPSFYVMVKALTGAFGLGPVTIRLTAILGYWLFCVCTYEIVARLVNRVWAVLALLLPVVSSALYYATEARGYGTVLGFTALAFLSWMLASEGVRRGITVPLIAFSLAAAVGSHYYAGLAVAPLAAGELVRTYMRRKLDLPIVVSFAGVLVPVLAFLPTIRQARGYSEHFWAKPAWMLMFGFYSQWESYLLSIATAGILVSLLVGFVRPLREPVSARMPIWQTIALAALVVLPSAYVAIGKLVTKGYTHRYAFPALIGFFVLFCVASATMARRRTIVAFAMICLACGFSVVQVLNLRNSALVARNDIAQEVKFLRQVADPVILVGEVTVFHRLSFYAPRDLVRRVAFPADPQLSVRYQDHDTVDRGLLDLNPWFPINAVPFRDFLLQHPSFAAYGYIGSWSWFTFELPELAREVNLLNRFGVRLLFHVAGVNRDQAVARTSGYKGKTGRPGLYAQQPSTGPSLCSQWFGASSCPELR